MTSTGTGICLKPTDKSRTTHHAWNWKDLQPLLPAFWQSFQWMNDHITYSWERKGHKLEHVRRCPVAFKNLWIQKPSPFWHGRKQRSENICLVPITLNHWLPQKSSSGECWSCLCLQSFCSSLALLNSTKAMANLFLKQGLLCLDLPLTKFRHHRSWCNWADSCRHWILVKVYYYKVKPTSVLSPWALAIVQHQLSPSDDGLMAVRSSEFGSSALHAYSRIGELRRWFVILKLAWYQFSNWKPFFVFFFKTFIAWIDL